MTGPLTGAAPGTAPTRAWAAAPGPAPADAVRLPVPHLARTVLAAAALAHLLALAGLVGSWSSYRSPWAAALILVGSAALPVVLVAAPRRAGAGGSLPRGVAPLVVAGMLAVSAALLADLPPQLWASWASWNWSTGAMVLLGLAVHVSHRRAVVLACGHGTLAVAAVLLGGGDPWRANLALVAATVPPLAAAHYLRLYTAALSARRDAVRDRALAAAGRRDPDVGVADARRLAVLREGIEPLLRDVADAAPLPLDAERSAAARRLAVQLREALAAQRRTLWLPGTAGGVPVRLVATDNATRATADGDRAWLAALIELLDRHPDWQHVRVVLDRRLDGSLTAVLTAAGPSARAAAADSRVRALCAGRSARCDADDGLLVVESEMSTKIGA